MSVKRNVIVFEEVHDGAHGQSYGGAAEHQPEVAGEIWETRGRNRRSGRPGCRGAEEGGGDEGDREDQKPHGEVGIECGEVYGGNPQQCYDGDGRDGREMLAGALGLGGREMVAGGDGHVPGRGEEDDGEGEGGHETGGAEAVEPETVHAPEGEQAYEHGEDDDAQAPAALHGCLCGDAAQEPGCEQAYGHRAPVDYTLCHFLDLRRGPPVYFGVHYAGPVRAHQGCQHAHQGAERDGCGPRHVRGPEPQGDMSKPVCGHNYG